MGKRSRDTGKRYELEFCRELMATPAGECYEATRNLGQERKGGADIILPGAPGLAVQVKYRTDDNLPLQLWWSQACDEAHAYTPMRVPVLAWRRPYHFWRIFMAAHDVVTGFENYPRQNHLYVVSMGMRMFGEICADRFEVLEALAKAGEE